MRKRVVAIVVGCVLIASGVTAIALSQIDQQRKMTQRELEVARQQQELQAQTNEEQKRLDEERRRLEYTAKEIEVERRRGAEQERRLAAEAERLRRQQAAVSQRKASEGEKKQAVERKLASRSAEHRERKEAVQRKREDTDLKRRGDDGPRREEAWDDERYGAASDWRVRIEGAPPRRISGQYDLNEVSRRATREAATLLRRVVYYNPSTGERVRAEPSGYSDMAVRVRVRAWDDRRLVSDTFEKLERYSRSYY